MMLTLAAAAAEEDRGWAGLVAIAIAIAVFAAIVRARGKLRERLDGPPAEDDVDVDLDDVDLDDDEALVDDPPRPGVWAGIWALLWDRDQVPLPSPTEDADLSEEPQVTEGVTEDDTTRDTTGDDAWWGEIVTLADGRRVRAHITSGQPATPDPDPEAEDDVDLGRWVAAQLAAGRRTTDIVDAGARRGASRSTVLRALRRVRQS